MTRHPEGVKEYIAACGDLCQVAQIDGKAVEAYKKRRLSEAEKKLLIHAAKDCKFRIAPTDGVHYWLVVGGKHFNDHKALYLEAFRKLCERGYIVYDGGYLFMLTSSGLKEASDLFRETGDISPLPKRPPSRKSWGAW